VVLLLAVAVLTVQVFHVPRPGRVPGDRPRGTDRQSLGLVAGAEPVRTFALVGAAGLTAVAVAVVVVGVLGRPDRAEGLAVIGLFGYLVYLPLMVLLAGWLARH
jgi:hypothetical protein